MREESREAIAERVAIGRLEEEERWGKADGLAQEGQEVDGWALWGYSVRPADVMQRQQEKWIDLAAVTLARQQTCSAKRMHEFAGLMVEAREAQMEAMLLARRRSEKRRRGEGNENKSLMEGKE